MTKMDASAVPGFDRLNALFSWWGLQGSNLTRLQTLFADLQEASRVAQAKHLESLAATNEQLLRCAQELSRCRDPSAFVAVETDIMRALLEGASRQTHAWGELTQRIHECCGTGVLERVQSSEGVLALAQRTQETVLPNGENETDVKVHRVSA